MLGLQEDTEPRNLMPAMLNMFIRTVADARLFCNGRAFLSYLIKRCCATWLMVVVVSGPLGRCGQPNILPHAIYEQPPQASLAVLQHRFRSWGLATPNAVTRARTGEQAHRLDGRGSSKTALQRRASSGLIQHPTPSPSTL